MKNILFSAAFSAGMLFSVPVFSHVIPAEVFTNNMVLQQGKPLNVWGTADVGEAVTVRLDGQKMTVKADGAGRWSVKLKAMKAQTQPVTFVISGPSNEVSLKDVLVGEVWVASGQSNMEYSMNNHPRYSKPLKGDKERLLHEYEQASNPMIRIMYIRKDLRSATLPTDGWQKLTPESLKPFSAAAYFFAKSLQDSLRVPVGVVSSAWGGTMIEDWTPAGMYDDNALLKNVDKGKTFSIRYQKMIAPMAPMTIKGFLWYQGEQNLVAGDTDIYTEKMRAMVAGWRKAWADDTLPFCFVQISPFLYSGRKQDPVPKTWQDLPRFWDAQTRCLDVIPHTSMVVTTDIPENLRDIHPPYKWVVGERLALCALNKAYGRTRVVCSGPTFKSMKREGDTIVISFDNIGGGLVTRNGKAPDWFYARDNRGKYGRVQAELRDNRVYIDASRLASPVELRFGWDETAQPNLMNKEGLPAVPFRVF